VRGAGWRSAHTLSALCGADKDIRSTAEGLYCIITREPAFYIAQRGGIKSVSASMMFPFYKAKPTAISYIMLMNSSCMCVCCCSERASACLPHQSSCNKKVVRYKRKQKAAFSFDGPAAHRHYYYICALHYYSAASAGQRVHVYCLVSLALSRVPPFIFGNDAALPKLPLVRRRNKKASAPHSAAA